MNAINWLSHFYPIAIIPLGDLAYNLTIDSLNFSEFLCHVYFLSVYIVKYDRFITSKFQITYFIVYIASPSCILYIYTKTTKYSLMAPVLILT